MAQPMIRPKDGYPALARDLLNGDVDGTEDFIENKYLSKPSSVLVLREMVENARDIAWQLADYKIRFGDARELYDERRKRMLEDHTLIYLMGNKREPVIQHYIITPPENWTKVMKWEGARLVQQHDIEARLRNINNTIKEEPVMIEPTPLHEIPEEVNHHKDSEVFPVDGGYVHISEDHRILFSHPNPDYDFPYQMYGTDDTWDDSYAIRRAFVDQVTDGALATYIPRDKMHPNISRIQVPVLHEIVRS